MRVRNVPSKGGGSSHGPLLCGTQWFCQHLSICVLVEGAGLVNPGPCLREGLSQPSACPCPPQPANRGAVWPLVAEKLASILHPRLP